MTIDYPDTRSENADSMDSVAQLFSNNGLARGEGLAVQKSRTVLTFSSVVLFVCGFVSNLLAASAFSVIAPFFPGVALSKGVSLSVTGLIFGVFELVIFLFSPFVVYISAKVGNKTLYIGGLSTCGICSILFSFLEHLPNGAPFAVMCFLVRSVCATGASVFLVASFATLACAFPDKVSTVNGVVETALALGYMLGPGLGGVLFDLGGFKLPLLTVGASLLVVACVCFKAIPNMSEEEVIEPVKFWILLRLPVAVLILLTFALLGAIESTIDIVMEPFVTQNFGLSHTIIGLLLLLPSLILSVSAIGWGFLSDKKGWNAGIVIFGLLLTAVGSIFLDPPRFLFKVSPGLYSMIPGLVCIGLGVSAALVPIYGLCLEQACRHGLQENAGTVNLISGVTNSAFSFGLFLGPTLGGYLYEAVGVSNLMLGYALLFLLLVPLFVIALGRPG